jgi:hypothetical protein
MGVTHILLKSHHHCQVALISFLRAQIKLAEDPTPETHVLKDDNA